MDVVLMQEAAESLRRQIQEYEGLVIQAANPVEIPRLTVV